MPNPPDKPRDWDKELAEVDRLLAKLPHADPTLGRGAKGPPPKSPGAGAPGHAAVLGPAVSSPRDRLGVWVRVGLALLLGLAMTQWPYSHACGLRLGFYLVGVGAVIAGAVWGALGSWRHRMGPAHGLSIGVLVWGLALLAGEVLPRTGYARTAAAWFCPEPPAAVSAPSAPAR
jgi:hypothetical protein